MASNYLLWGEGKCEFIIDRVGKDSIYILPHPADIRDYSLPDTILHNKAGGIKDFIHRGFWPHIELFYNMIEQSDQIIIRDLINATARKEDIWFRPHRDWPRQFKVTVNFTEGWNYDLAFHKYANKVSGWVIIKGLERIQQIDDTLTYKIIGGKNPINYPVYAYLLLNNCDALTDWAGDSLSLDTVDKQEGTGSVKDDVGAPVPAVTYDTIYDPAGTWDLSTYNKIELWLKSDRANTAYTSARLYIYEGANWRYWDLVFLANTWTGYGKILTSSDGVSGVAPDLTIIDNVQIRFKAADGVAFYKKIDHLCVAE